MYDAGDYGAALDKALEMSDYKNFARARRLPPRRASCAAWSSAYIEACGIAPSRGGLVGAGVGWESAESG
jgi:carbon-monoxide dehydrogenase large subunit